MLNLKEVVANPNDVKAKLATRGLDGQVIDDVVALARRRSSLMQQLQKLEAERNSLSRSIGQAKAQGLDQAKLLNEVATIKRAIEKLKAATSAVNRDLNYKLLRIPNIPLAVVPQGAGEHANVVLKEHIIGRGKVTNVRPHYEFGVARGLINFTKAVKVASTRFWMYQNEGAKLMRALKNFMLDEHLQTGYTEVMPPLIVNAKTMQGTGQLPKFAADLFKLSGQESYLIPTAEVPLTNLYANSIVDLTRPKMLTSHTPCFRAEAGAGGKDMKGLIRGHQFYKVEVVKITTRSALEAEFQKTLHDCKVLLEKLCLTYREVMLCTGDLGFAADRTVDLEVWIPSENRYREVSSVSSFGDFQARRAMIRYRNADGQTEYAHTINGSGLSLDRVVAAIMEVYQEGDKLIVPPVLAPYFQGGVI